jgi:virginiamycin A acetyltransferase
MGRGLTWPVLPGVSIGNGAIIGAYAVVGSDIPPYCISVGNPARVIRVRFDPDIVGTLNEIAWWDWPAERITRNLNAIRGADIEALKRAK